MSAIQEYKAHPQDEQSRWVPKSGHDMKMTREAG